MLASKSDHQRLLRMGALLPPDQPTLISIWHTVEHKLGLTATSAATTATTASPATATSTAAVASPLVKARVNLLLGLCEYANEITGLLGVWKKVRRRTQ